MAVAKELAQHILSDIRTSKWKCWPKCLAKARRCDETEQTKRRNLRYSPHLVTCFRFCFRLLEISRGIVDIAKDPSAMASNDLQSVRISMIRAGPQSR